jgi:hypothetical protein
MRIRQLIAIAAFAGIALPAISAEPNVPFKPFLECAGSRAYYLHLLQRSNYDDAKQLKEVQDSIQFYLQIAESLTERNLQSEFVEISESEKEKAEKIIKAGGSKAYLAYDAERQEACSRLVRDHQSEIMKAVDKQYQRQDKR